MATTREPPSSGGGGPTPGSFAHQDVGSIAGTFGNGNNPRTATAFTAQHSINYGQQNAAPFNTSQDWNSTIEKAYSYTAYATRTQAAAFAALMHRTPNPQGSWPYGNSWESAWWINSSGGNGDLLIVVFNAMRTLNGINIENNTSTYGNSNPIVYAAALTGTPGSFYQTQLGSVSWGSPSGASLSSATISISSVSVQAVALWIEGTTGWTRTETIRFMK